MPPAYDPVKRKEYNDRYYAKNADKVKRRASEYYLENKEAISAHRQIYNKERHLRMKKEREISKIFPLLVFSLILNKACIESIVKFC